MVLFTAEGLSIQGQTSGEFVTVLPTLPPPPLIRLLPHSLTHTLCCYHIYVPAQPPRSTLHLGNLISAVKPNRGELVRRQPNWPRSIPNDKSKPIMPTFSSRPHAPSESTQRFQQILRSLRKRPFLLFGAPFLSLMVVSSFALQNLTKTRFDYQSSKTSTMTMEEGLGMGKDRKRVDIREEYFVSILAIRSGGEDGGQCKMGQTEPCYSVRGTPRCQPSDPPSSLRMTS